MSKYIVDIPDGVEWGVVTCRTEDGFYTRDFDSLEELNSDYINEHYGSLQDEAYQAGLNDAWEAARRIVVDTDHGGLALGTLSRIFGTRSYSYIMRENTVQEAIAKLKAYEEHKDDSIKVGDEVEWDNDSTGDRFIVTRIYQPYGKKEQCDGIDDDGDVYRAVLIESLVKTGRHFDIASILEDMSHD